MGSFAAEIRSATRSASLLLATFVTAALMPASAPAHEASRTLRAELPARGLRTVDLDFTAGSLEIRGTSGTTVRLIVEARCDDEAEDRCEQILERVRVDSNVDGRTLELEVDGLSDFSRVDIDIEAMLEIPRGLALDLDMGAGEVEIDGLESSVNVNLGAGDAAIRVPERAVRSVELAVGIGEVSLVRNGKRQEFVRIFSSPIRWKAGTGRSRVDVSLGVGAAEVTLR